VLVNRVAVDKPRRCAASTAGVHDIRGSEAAGGGKGMGRSGASIWQMAQRVRVHLDQWRDANNLRLPHTPRVGRRGIWCQSTNVVVSNCVLTGNSAGEGDGTYFTDSYGGGVFGATLNHCTFTGKLGCLRWWGVSQHAEPLHIDRELGCVWRGVFGCTLYNCTLTA